MPQIRFNRQSQGVIAGDVEGADVSGPGGPNALPSVMGGELAREPAPESQQPPRDRRH